MVGPNVAANIRFLRLVAGLSLVAGAGLGAELTSTGPAWGQFFDDRYPDFIYRDRRQEPQSLEERPVDHSRAPAPRKADTPPSIKILVFGDSMADWLAYGLEDGFSESPEIGIVRKHKTVSGLIRYDSRNEAQDWVQIARDIIAAEKPHAIVFMVGLHDRQPIRERQPTRNAPQPGQPANLQSPDASETEPLIAAPEPQRGRFHEFRNEKWQELYTKRIDDTIAALKTAGVPVLWVGLPSIRGTRSTNDALYLDELYRARAEHAGIIYVDVWDGFVDEQGRFTARGPDFEGQIRPLRPSDGVHFTRAGAKKLAHYVDRELRRLALSPFSTIALPAPEPAMPVTPPPARPGIQGPRPLAGPVLLLNSPAQDSEELLGGGGAQQVAADALASRVLVTGETVAAVAGRADDFAWPPRAPNAKFDGALPPSGPPVVASRPAKATQTSQTERPAPGTRVAGQGQVRPQRPAYRPPPPPPPAYAPSRGFFGLFR
jgi:uncharacterized protein